MKYAWRTWRSLFWPGFSYAHLPTMQSISPHFDVDGGNPAPLFFAQIFGENDADVQAVAVAVRSEVAGYLVNGRSRFMIDDEMIDSDEPAIQDLAYDLGKDPIDIISDLDGDWFIDLPPGTTLWLPTGQFQDEALFEIGPEFQRSDVLAQLLRLRFYADTFGVLEIDRATVESEVAALIEFQQQSSDPRADGGFAFARRGTELVHHINPLSTVLALQALTMWESAEQGAFRDPWNVLL